jgi:Bcl-2 family protein
MCSLYYALLMQYPISYQLSISVNASLIISSRMTTPTTTTTTTIYKPEVQIFSPTDAPTTTILKSATKAAALKRKFSFPANLHSSTFLSTESGVIARTTRRLSTNVSDRVSERVRKLSTAMGLGWNHAPSKEILLSQAKFLITLYVRHRLKRSGILNQQKRKLALQKIQRSMLGVGDVKEVFLAIKEVLHDD